ncbi:MAG: hypothetical protein K0R65_3071 [Crocinitomicaceae bacterium]|jgi:hypothetical protein|nr:hypothetical protein [Crocinitomicaceae bacterium]
MKKTLTICHLLILSPVFSQQNTAFIDEIQVFTGFNNVAWGSTNYDSKTAAERVYPEAQNHSWDLSYPLDDSYGEFDFPWLRMPSFYINAVAGHRLNIPYCSWRFGVNYISSNISLEDFDGRGTLNHDYTTDDSGNTTYRQSQESLSYSFDILTSKLSVENAFYFRSGHPGSKRSLYAGISTQLGIAYTRYNYSYSRDTWEYEVDPGGYKQELSFSSYDFRGNEKGKTGPYASANLLFGYDRKLGTGKAGQVSTHLFTEFKPGFCAFYAPELKGWKTTYNGFWSLVGLRFTFNDEGIEPRPEK